MTLWPRRRLAARGRLHAREHADQGRFARAVHAHQRDAIAAVDGKAHVLEHLLGAVVLGQVRDLHHRAAGRLWLGKGEVDRLLLDRDLDALDLLQLLDAALHLLGLGGLVAKAADEGFKMLDVLALVFVSRGQLGSPLFLLRQVLLVVAVVNVQGLVPYLDGLVDRDVEKVAIVGDQDVAVGIVVEVALQPVAGFQVQVVGGLVEQQQAGLLQQQLGQRDAHLPAAGKLLCLPGPVMLAEAQAAQYRAHLRVECIAVVGAKVGVEMREAIGGRGVFGRCRVKLGQARGKGFQFLLHARATRRRPTGTRQKRCGRTSARPSWGR